jgi:hypothetical protein
VVVLLVVEGFDGDAVEVLLDEWQGECVLDVIEIVVVAAASLLSSCCRSQYYIPINLCSHMHLESEEKTQRNFDFRISSIKKLSLCPTVSSMQHFSVNDIPVPGL